MAKRICGYCGGEVVGKHCLRPECQESFKKRLKQRIQKKILDYQKEVELLRSFKTTSLNLEDYSKLKDIKLEKPISNKQNLLKEE